ncbi:MAG: efflux RND transporter periplasmic adaptor subunit [Flavobacteriaceae bacterium]|nr:efflux RND transporter periplasmic adaptor subunit [Flavobacteriaceae bacterium]
MMNYKTYLFALFSIFFFLGCQEEQKEKKEKEIQEFPVLTLERSDVTTYKSYPARVEGIISSEIRAKVPGYITDVLVDEGQKVSKGQTLFKLETQSLDGEAAAAKARMESAAYEVEKLQPLVEKEIVSEIELRTAKANYQDAKSNFNSIQANIDYANIRSSVDGYVGRISYRNGALVSPGDAMPLTRVAKIEEVFVYFSMNEKDFLDFVDEADGEVIEDKISNFPPVDFMLSNGIKYAEQGKIEAISGDVNQITGTITFRAKFPNPNRIIRDGASGSVLLPTTYENKLLIPTVSTFERQNKRFVFLVEKDSLIEKPIQIKDRNEQIYVLENGLEEGDQIMARGLNRVKEGDQIKVKKVTLDDVIEEYEQVFK